MLIILVIFLWKITNFEEKNVFFKQKAEKTSDQMSVKSETSDSISELDRRAGVSKRKAFVIKREAPNWGGLCGKFIIYFPTKNFERV